MHRFLRTAGGPSRSLSTAAAFKDPMQKRETGTVATNVGESGAYRGILDALAGVGLSLAGVEELGPLRATLAERRVTAEVDAVSEFSRIEQEHCARIAEKEPQVAAILDGQRPIFEAELATITAGTKEAEGAVAEVGSFFRNLLPPTRLPLWLRARRNLARERTKLSAKHREIDAFVRSTEAPLIQLRGALERHRRDRDRFVQSRVRAVAEQLACVSRLIDEGEAGGAAAKLEVIEKLAALPEGWFIVSNVELEADRWIYFNEQHLRSAQLDHVVVGPGGVFVVETKNWSREFTESGQFFDPYQQIARSSYLCHRLLKERGLPSKTRAIIATRSRLPSKPPDSYTKVLRPDELCGYICWFKVEIARDDVSRIVAFLSKPHGGVAIRAPQRRRRAS